MIFKKLSLYALGLLSSATFAQFNYGEALQKALFFYEVQQSGELPSWNRVSWRGDSATDDGKDVGLDLTGGWYDAGDHVKFNFPMAYSVTTLAWGGIEFEDAYRKKGQLDILKRNLRFVTDYLLKCHTGPTELYGQVGNGGLDHAYWGSPEVYPQERPSYKITASAPGSDLAAETAAAMSAVAILLKDDDAAYSARLITSAKQLYDFADNFRGEYSSSITDAAGFYRSFSSYQDEIVWGAAWLYRATGEAKYLAKAEAEYDNMQREGQSTTAKYKEAFSWDDKAYGSYVLLAELTGKDKYKQDAERNLDYFTVGVDGEKVPTTPGGLPHLRQWGTIRYSANESLLALIYSDKVTTDPVKQARYTNFAKFIADYALGDNPINRSFMVGFGNNPANNPHHRAAHGGWTNSSNGLPVLPSHTIFGAVVGGPKSPSDDNFIDDRSEFIANEVACDYNAGITGVLAYMSDKFGGNPLANFPVAEVPTRAEMRSFTKFNSNNAFGSTVKVLVQNRSSWPARVADKLSFRYYFDISEGIAAGKTIADYDIQFNGIGSSAQMAIKSAGGSQYYAEITNIPSIAPIGDPQFRSEAQINIRVQNGVPYDTANDWSAQGINGTTELESPNIPVYDNGVLVFGQEPNGVIVDTNTAPVASLGIDKNSGVAPLAVEFDASGSTDVDGDSLTYLWDFGNGNTSTEEKPSTIYTTSGSYLVTLTVNDGQLNSVPKTTTISVTDDGVTVDGGTLSGGPFAFTVGDGIADNVSGVSLTGNTGANSGYIVTDESLKILGLPPTPSAVNFDIAGEGVCLIWHISYEDGLTGLTEDANVGNLTGTYDLSNSVSVTRTNVLDISPTGDCKFGTPTAASLANINSAFENIYVLGSNGPDLGNVTNFTINWDAANNGLYQFSMNTNNGVPTWYNDFLPKVSQNFNSANPAVTITGSGIANLDGAYYATVDAGNFVLVSQTGGYTIYFSNSGTAPNCDDTDPDTADVDGGTLSGGPFTFTVGDGIADNVSGVSLTGNTGANSGYIVTDESLKILGLPPTPEAVNFDGAGVGVCLIWHISYEDGLTGLAEDANVANLSGTYDLSNSITVTRNASAAVVDGGTLSGGPFTFTVGDGIADNASGVSLTGNTGANSGYIVTDESLKILGLPPTPEAVNFDGAGAGVCLIWHISYEDGLAGLAEDANLASLVGMYDLSNSVSVTRNLFIDGGITGDCKFGTPTAASLASINSAFENIYVLGSNGPDLGNVTNFSINWDAPNNGLYQFSMNTNNGVPTWYNDFLPKVSQNFNSANPAVTITGSGIANLDGAYYATADAGNFVLVSQTGGYTIYFSNSDTAPNCDDTDPDTIDVDGGALSGGPFTFTVGDGIADNVSGVSLTGNTGANSGYIVTDESLKILGLPPTPEAVNFDGAGVGVCLIWHISYEDGLTGLAEDANVANLSGTYDLSNSITVTRNAVGVTVNGGTIATSIGTTSVTTITGDGVDDIVVFTNTSTSTEEYIYLITDESGNVLTTETASHNFEGASVGICKVYGLSYTGTLSVAGKNVADAGLSSGEFMMSSNSITITRNDDIVIVDPVDPDPTTGDNKYIDRFTEMRNEFYDPANGYFSKDGSPHHSIETLIVEAPDHGHESTSELYSYWLMLEAMQGRVTKDWQPLAKVWSEMERMIIPTKADQPTNAAYSSSSPAAYASEFPLPTQYPAPLNFTAAVGQDPVSDELAAAYGPEVYQMHWLLDNDNFYGYGNRGDGTSTPSYINTFQRGEQESVYETIPHPSWEAFNFGNSENGFLPLFIEDQSYAKQWRYTSAPDADARAVQAMYWAIQYAKEQDGQIDPTLLDNTKKMGDYLRLSMFDKYFKKIGSQDELGSAGTGYDSAHYLMSWYTSWGGSADPASSWAFRISSSHCHFGYQNPVAAYALTNLDELDLKTPNGERDWSTSLTRQMEFYRYLQSADGAIAGGATNSWNGNYSQYPAGKSTFYDMAYDDNPVYHDPGSGTWFGWQAWSVERVAEYYYISNDPLAKEIMDKWATWAIAQVNLIGTNDFEVPAGLEWTGEPDTWNPNSPGANSNLRVVVTSHNQDLGIAASLAKTLTYYAAATEKHATLNVEAKTLAREILDRMWVTYRDDKGVSAPESRGDYKRMFEEQVHVPAGYTGTMANGDEVKSGITFLDIRSGLKNDPAYPALKAAYDGGQDYTTNYHRSWAQIEVALANAEYGFFFGEESTLGAKAIDFDASIFPNPASDIVTITSKTSISASGKTFVLIDLLGQEVARQDAPEGASQATFDVSNFASGMYLVRILDKGVVIQVEKLIVN